MQLQGNVPQRRHFVEESSAVGEARRDAQRLAAQAGLDETSVARAGIVATELSTNLLRHAGRGELLLQIIATSAGAQIEVLAVDAGPGMADVDRCVRDGYSTGGTAGTGLGAVKRLSASFDVHSIVGRGSAVMARIGPGDSRRFGAICTAIRGETVPGDAWRLAVRDAEFSLAVFDGLGHGLLAAEAAAAAADVFCSEPFDPPARVIERVHARLSGTRGAAGACLRRWSDGRLSFAGIGNVAARVSGASRSQGLVSHNGTLGLQARRIQQFEHPAQRNALVVVHSDGLSARWELNDYEDLRHHHPAVVAAVLYRDHGRARDDSTIVVLCDE